MTFIIQADLIASTNGTYTIPFTICNYDTEAKNYKIEFYNELGSLICTKIVNQLLPPCMVTIMGSSEGNEKDIFDLKTKSLKQKEIVFEYYTKRDDFVEIELFNKYNVSLGVVQSKESKKGANEFRLNIEKYKPGIYVFKMNGKENSIIRRLIIE